MDYRTRRPVTCYACGRILGHVDVTLEGEHSPDGMRRFREAAEALRRQHRCDPPYEPPSRRAASNNRSEEG